MSRIKLSLPEIFHFSCEIPLRITDMNYGNHLGNDSMLSLIHEARMQYLASFQCTELDLDGVSLIMGDVAIVFKSEGFYGDTLLCHVQASDFSNSAFAIYYLFVSKKTGKSVAEAKTGMVCFDYTDRKVKSIPDAFIQKIELLHK